MAKKPAPPGAIVVATAISTAAVFIFSFLINVVFALPCIADGYPHSDYCSENTSFGLKGWLVVLAPPALTLLAGWVSSSRRWSWLPVVIVGLGLVPVMILVQLFWTGEIG